MMKTAVLLCCTFFPFQALALNGPLISSPQDTEGVVKRDVERLDVKNEKDENGRPPRKPVRGEAASSQENNDEQTVEDSWKMPTEFLSKSPYELKYEIRGDFLMKVARGENVTRPEFKLATDFSGVVPRVQIAAEERVVILPTRPKPRDAMSNYAIAHLADLYGIKEIDGDEGYDRLLMLAEGKEDFQQKAAQISAESYEFPEVAEPLSAESEVGAAPVMNFVQQTGMIDPAAAILNSLSQEQVQALTPQQITAVVMAAHGKSMDLVQASMMQPQAQPMSAPAVLQGIPSLDYRGDQLPAATAISARDVPDGSMPFSDPSNVQAPPQASMPQPLQQPQMIMASKPASEPVVVGNGENLLLKGWKLGLTGTGHIGMYMSGDPGSIIEISEGMVIGPLGSIEKLSMENGEIIARFSTGEVMTSPAALVSLASL